MEPALKAQPDSQQSFRAHTLYPALIWPLGTQKGTRFSLCAPNRHGRKETHTPTPFHHSKIQSVTEPQGKRLTAEVIPELNL